MKIKNGFVHRTICGEHVVVGEGLAQVNFNRILSLNATAAYLWDQVAGRDFTKEDLVKLLLDKYEVSREVATADTDKLVNTWEQQGILE